MFKKYFPKSYGFDMFTWFLLITSIYFVFNKYTAAITAILVIYALFRAFSRNKPKRYKELMKFNSIMLKISGFLYRVFTPIVRKVKFWFKRIKDSRKYKYTKCSNCNKQMRLPRGKGTIMVTCPNCYTRFKFKT